MEIYYSLWISSSYLETRAAFPRVRLILLIQAGSHLIVDALISLYCIRERVQAKKLLCSAPKEMLLMWDRDLYSCAMVRATLFQGCGYLG